MVVGEEEQNPDYSQAGDSPEPIVWEVQVAQTGERLDRVLALQLPGYSRSRLQRWIALGAVRVDGRLRMPKARVHLGSLIEVVPQPNEAQQAFVPDDIALDIRYEDDDLLCVNKPAGLVTHPGHGNWRGTLMNGLLFHRPTCASLPRAGIVHRLDKDTSGLMVVAKTAAAMLSLVGQLAARQVDRRYLALVEGTLDSDQIVEAPIGRDPKDPLKMAVVTTGAGREAATLISPIASVNGATLVQCKLATGRTHQIRVHLRSLGYPLLGDTTYGSKKNTVSTEPIIRRQALHAWRLAFNHPRNGQIVQVQSEPEADFLSACVALGLQHSWEKVCNEPFVPNLSANLITMLQARST
jgi:23S rRNA pseudouridine1911/1915/1917 synthase